MNTNQPARKPWFKNWKVLAPIIIVLALIGFIGGRMEQPSGDTQAAKETTMNEQTEQAPRWQQSDAYQENCTTAPTIAGELQDVVNAVEIPESGHVANAALNADADNPDMVRAFFAICTPATGDDLRAIAEQFAIELKQSEHAGSISEIGVNASAANPGATESILRNDSFQMRNHDGGESLSNGSYRAAWTSQN